MQRAKGGTATSGLIYFSGFGPPSLGTNARRCCQNIPLLTSGSNLCFLEPSILLTFGLSAQYFLSPVLQLFLHPVLEPRIALELPQTLTLPPSASNFDALSTQQPFAAGFCSSAILYHLTMIANQGSVLFLLHSRHRDHTEGFVLAPQITLQRVTQLGAVTLIGLLPLGFSSPHRLGRHHQVLDSQFYQLTM